MELSFTSLHQVDHVEDLINPIEISSQSEELTTYVERLLNQIVTSTNNRRFYFHSETTEVRLAISKMLEDTFQEAIEIVTKRLIDKEQEAQEAYGHLGIEVQRGSLFQALITHEEKRKLIISKADHSEFLDEEDFELHRGLPWKKRIFKALLVEFGSSNEIESVYVHDTGSTISKYWWHDFLELKEKYTDEHNTNMSLDLLDRKVFSKIKKKYPKDHEILRNSSLGYYRNKDEFQLDEYVELLFERYTPHDDDLDIPDLIRRTKELPDRWGFDRRFAIKKEAINKRAVNKINVHPYIDLIIKDHISNFEEIISTDEDDEGNKYLRIRTVEEVYNKFKA